MTFAKDRLRSRAVAPAAGGCSRRVLVGRAAAAGILAAAGPWLRRGARAAEGTLRWLTWDDYAPQALVERFERDTGIKLEVTTYPTNEALLNRLRAGKGEGFDLCSPSVTWVPALVQEGALLALDESRLANLKNIVPSIVEQAATFGAIIGGTRYACPYAWGTEALGYNSAELKLEYGKASFGDLWDPAYKGRVACRLTSALLGVGLWLERRGELPEGAMRRAYDDEAAFDLAYGKAAAFVGLRKDQIGAHWTGTLDTQEAFLQKGCVIGQTWDGPVLQLKNDGRPYSYLAPVEGALAWLDSIAIPAGAANLDQAYAFIDWSLQPQIGAIVSDNTGYNSVVAGFEAHVGEAFKRNFEEAYPGDAVRRLWFKGIEQPWFIQKLHDHVGKIAGA